jgi:hypothetical protein
MEPILNGWHFQTDHERLRLIRKCDPADLTQETLESIVGNRRHPIAAFKTMMERNPNLIINERLLISGAAVGRIGCLLEELLPESASLLTQGVLIAAAQTFDYASFTTIVENGSFIISEDVLIALMQNQDLAPEKNLRGGLRNAERFLMEELQKMYCFHITERVIRTALEFKNHTMSFITWLILKSQIYQGPVIEKAILEVIAQSDNYDYIQYCMSLLKQLQGKLTFKFTEEMLEGLIKPRSFSEIRAPLLAWLLDNGECCIDK